MNKELFIETINCLEKQYRKDLSNEEALLKVFPEGSMLIYDNDIIVMQLIKILKTFMDDDHKDSWIDYFIYELDFGVGFKPGWASYADGSNINLSNAENLYEFLIENKKSK